MSKEYLWNKALLVTKKALKTSSLKPLETQKKHINNDINDTYEIRSLKGQINIFENYIGPRVNPFLPYDEKLYVSEVLHSHNLILNKYPIQLAHLLLITNKWKPQIGWLERSDFDALIDVNKDTSGLDEVFDTVIKTEDVV